MRAYHYTRLDGQRGTLYAESETRARRFLTDLYDTPSGTQQPGQKPRYPPDWEFGLMAGEDYRTTTKRSEP